MSTSFEDRAFVALMAAKQAKGANLCEVEIKQVLRVQYEIAAKEWEARRKAKAKSGIDERAHGIYKLYPRSEGGNAALQKITKAIDEHGFDKVYEGTREYASAVARWSHARRVSQSGSSMIPMPATWFGNARYLDDPKHWWEGTGKKGAADVERETEEKKALALQEPQGWRFAHPETRFVKENIPWDKIDTLSQKWIIANTPPPMERHA